MNSGHEPVRREALDVSTGACGRWLLKRNCALSPRQLALFYVSVVALSLLIGIGFAVVGAWLVLPFAGLEVLGLGVALLYYGRHATDRELIELSGDRLRIESRDGGKTSSIELDRRLVRVRVKGQPYGRHGLVLLCQPGREVVVGRYVGERERSTFTQELRRALAG